MWASGNSQTVNSWRPYRDSQETSPISVPAISKGALAANPVRPSFTMVEPHHLPCLLNSHKSKVMQAKLDKLRNHFHVPHAISMRVPQMGEFPQQARRELGEIVFPAIALECGVRFLLAPFVKRLLSEFSLHPL